MIDDGDHPIIEVARRIAKILVGLLKQWVVAKVQGHQRAGVHSFQSVHGAIVTRIVFGAQIDRIAARLHREISVDLLDCAKTHAERGIAQIVDADHQLANDAIGDQKGFQRRRTRQRFHRAAERCIAGTEIRQGPGRRLGFAFSGRLRRALRHRVLGWLRRLGRRPGINRLRRHRRVFPALVPVIAERADENDGRQDRQCSECAFVVHGSSLRLRSGCGKDPPANPGACQAPFIRHAFQWPPELHRRCGEPAWWLLWGRGLRTISARPRHTRAYA